MCIRDRTTLVPSVYLAVNLVQKEWFDSNAARFVQQVLRSKPNVLVVSQEPNFKGRQLRVNLVGDRLPEADIKAVSYTHLDVYKRQPRPLQTPSTR